MYVLWVLLEVEFLIVFFKGYLWFELYIEVGWFWGVENYVFFVGCVFIMYIGCYCGSFWCLVFLLIDI